MTEQRNQGDFAAGWDTASPMVARMALALNNADDNPMVFSHANKASQEQLLMRAEVLLTELNKLGVIILHPQDPALQERLANFVLSILEPPNGIN